MTVQPDLCQTFSETTLLVFPRGGSNVDRLFLFQLLVFIYMELERRKGFITSGVLFIYWLLACLTFIIPFYTEIIKEVSLPTGTWSSINKIIRQKKIIPLFLRPLFEETDAGFLF